MAISWIVSRVVGVAVLSGIARSARFGQGGISHCVEPCQLFRHSIAGLRMFGGSGTWAGMTRFQFLVNGLLQALGWIPLRIGRLDRDAFSKAVSLIKEGKPVAIFPEGGRTMTGALKPGKPGIGVIVAQTGCQVVPAYIRGTFAVLPPGAKWPGFHPVTVAFGTPIDFSADAAQLEGKAFYQHVSRTVMGKIAELGQVRLLGTGRRKPGSATISIPRQRPSLATLSKIWLLSHSAPGSSRRTRIFS